MKRAAVLCLAAACFLMAGPAAHADPITTDYSWGYQFKPDGQTDNRILTNGAKGDIVLPGDGGNKNMLTASGASVQISTSVWEGSTATQAHPQTVSDLPFTTNIKLTDNASGLSGYVSFGGSLNGTIWNGGSNLQATLSTDPKTIDIDHHLYTVSFDQFVTPANGGPGQLVFDVKVQHNPEPSSLVLAGIGLPLMGLAFRRRKRKENA